MRMEEYEKSTTFRHPPLGSKEDCALANAVAYSKASKTRIRMQFFYYFIILFLLIDEPCNTSM